MSAMTRSTILQGARLRRPRGRLRHPSLLVAVVGALALGACGSSNGNGGAGGGTSNDDKAFQGALKYAQCMRDHGIDMPDPQRVGNGGIKQTMKAGANVSNAKMQAAQKDCQKYMSVGGGRTLSAGERAKVQNAMLDYAKCMRAHGVDMPDPKFNNSGGGVTFQLGGPGKTGGSTGGPNPESPAFKKADEACHSKLAGLAKGGPDGGPSTQSSGGDQG
jgi:hypothetical protein